MRDSKVRSRLFSTQAEEFCRENAEILAVADRGETSSSGGPRHLDDGPWL